MQNFLKKYLILFGTFKNKYNTTEAHLNRIIITRICVLDYGFSIVFSKNR